MKKRTLNLSKKERNRRRLQALKNFKKNKRKKRSVNSMARKRKKTASKHYGKSQSSVLIGSVLAASVYGGSRQYLAAFIEPVLAKLPAGKYWDNVLLGLVGYGLARHGKNKHVKRFGRAALIVEGAMLGSEIVARTSTTNAF